MDSLLLPLPNELMIEMAKHLTISDLVSWENVSRRFSALFSSTELDWIWKRPFEREYERYKDKDYWDLPDEADPAYGLCDYFYLDGLMSDEDPEMPTWDEEMIEFYLEDRKTRMQRKEYVKASKLSESSWRYRSKRYLFEEDRIVELAANVILSTDPPATLEQIRETEERLNIEIPRPIRKLYMLKNGGKIKHWDAEELLPLSEWIIRSPVEYSELYLAEKIPGSNLWGTDYVERFVKENSSSESRKYWDKFICFIKGKGPVYHTGLFFMFFNGHPYDAHAVEDIWCLWEHTDPSGNGGYHKTHCSEYRNGTEMEIARVHTFLKELATSRCARLPY